MHKNYNNNNIINIIMNIDFHAMLCIFVNVFLSIRSDII